MANRSWSKGRPFSTVMIGATAAVVALTLTAAAPASAQRQRGGFGGGQQGGGQQGGGQQGGGQRGGMAFQRPAPTLVSVPVTAITPYFGLNEDQSKQIEKIQKDARAGITEFFTNMQEQRQQQQGNGTQPTQAERDAQRAERTKMMAEGQTKLQEYQKNEEAAAKAIRLIIPEELRPAIPAFLRDVELFQKVGLPIELIKPLAVENAQKVKFNTITQRAEEADQARRQEMMTQMRQSRGQNNQNGGGQTNGGPQVNFQAMMEAQKTEREATHQKILAVLTEEQRALVEKWEKDHPGGAQRGGFGGFGGGTGGGFGGGRGAGGQGGQRGGGASQSTGTGV